MRCEVPAGARAAEGIGGLLSREPAEDLPELVPELSRPLSAPIRYTIEGDDEYLRVAEKVVLLLP